MGGHLRCLFLSLRGLREVPVWAVGSRPSQGPSSQSSAEEGRTAPRPSPIAKARSHPCPSGKGAEERRRQGGAGGIGWHPGH